MRKNKSAGPRTTKCFSVTVPKELLPEIHRVAYESGRSISGYLSYLVRRDTGHWRK